MSQSENFMSAYRCISRDSQDDDEFCSRPEWDKREKCAKCGTLYPQEDHKVCPVCAVFDSGIPIFGFPAPLVIELMKKLEITHKETEAEIRKYTSRNEYCGTCKKCKEQKGCSEIEFAKFAIKQLTNKKADCERYIDQCARFFYDVWVIHGFWTTQKSVAQKIAKYFTEMCYINAGIKNVKAETAVGRLIYVENFDEFLKREEQRTVGRVIYVDDNEFLKLEEPKTISE